MRTFSPDATTENADWTKQGWDFAPYKSAEFFEQIGGAEALDKFRESPAYAAACERGIIHDDEWVLDWCEPVRGPQPEPQPGARRDVHVHIHRRP
jgi:hypothetical protein